MKRNISVISMLMALSMLFAVISPTAFAMSSVQESATREFVNLCTDGSTYFYGAEDAEKRYVFQVNADEMSGYVVIVYLKNPDFMHEYRFDLPADQIDAESPAYWVSLLNLCLINAESWVTTCIPEAITTTPLPSSSAASRTATYNDEYFVGRFESWLNDNYGPEYVGVSISSIIQNGVSMNLKTGRNLDAYKDSSFYFTTSISVVAFIATYGTSAAISWTSFLPSLLDIADENGMFQQGETLHQYVVRVLDYKYVLVEDSHYPYSMAQRHCIFTGIAYTKSGAAIVPPEVDPQIIYAPSEAYYNSAYTQFNAAYNEYLTIGWQEGGFP